MLVEKGILFFFSYEIRIFCRWVWKDCNTKKGGSFQKSPPVALKLFTMFYRTLFPISLNLQTDTKVSKHRCHFLSNHHFDIQPSLLSLRLFIWQHYSSTAQIVKSVQVALCQINICCHQLTQKMTTKIPQISTNCSK